MKNIETAFKYWCNEQSDLSFDDEELAEKVFYEAVSWFIARMSFYVAMYSDSKEGDIEATAFMTSVLDELGKKGMFNESLR